MKIPVELERQISAEEAVALLRHDVRNKLAAIRNAAFYLLQKAAASPSPDPRSKTFLELIDKEVAAAEARLQEESPFAALRLRAPGPLELGAVVRAAGVDVDVRETRRVQADAAEVHALVGWLVELAAELGATRREARTLDCDGGAALELALSPCAPLDPDSPPEGPAGVALRLARRVARRAGSSLGARVEGDGVVLRVELPEAAP